MYVFDIDGTLANLDHRLHHIQKTPKDWDAFYEACDRDSLIDPIAKIAWNLTGNTIVYVTGRSEQVRDKTILWLNHHSLWMPNGNSVLLMRQIWDHRPDHIIKPELVAPFKDQITAIFEDRASVVKAYRDMGLTCLQVADGEF